MMKLHLLTGSISWQGAYKITEIINDNFVIRLPKIIAYFSCQMRSEICQGGGGGGGGGVRFSVPKAWKFQRGMGNFILMANFGKSLGKEFSITIVKIKSG